MLISFFPLIRYSKGLMLNSDEFLNILLGENNSSNVNILYRNLLVREIAILSSSEDATKSDFSKLSCILKE